MIMLHISGLHFILLLKFPNYPTAGDMRLQALPKVSRANDCEDKSNDCKYHGDGAEICQDCQVKKYAEEGVPSQKNILTQEQCD